MLSRLLVAAEIGCRFKHVMAGASPWYERLPLLKGWLDVAALARCGGANVHMICDDAAAAVTSL